MDEEPKPLFRGQFEHAIDDKGRLSIPAKFREVLREEKTLVLTGSESFVTAYPLTEWRALEERLRANPKFKREQRDSDGHCDGGPHC